MLDLKSMIIGVLFGVALVFSFGATWIFDAKIIENLFLNRLVNMHGTLLPRDRGGAPYSWLAMRRARLGTSLFHLVDEGTDTGDIIMMREFIYPASCKKPADYHSLSVSNGTELFTEFLDKLEKWRIKRA